MAVRFSSFSEFSGMPGLVESSIKPSAFGSCPSRATRQIVSPARAEEDRRAEYTQTQNVAIDGNASLANSSPDLLYTDGVSVHIPDPEYSTDDQDDSSSSCGLDNSPLAVSNGQACLENEGELPENGLVDSQDECENSDEDSLETSQYDLRKSDSFAGSELDCYNQISGTSYAGIYLDNFSCPEVTGRVKSSSFDNKDDIIYNSDIVMKEDTDNWGDSTVRSKDEGPVCTNSGCQTPSSISDLLNNEVDRRQSFTCGDQSMSETLGSLEVDLSDSASGNQRQRSLGPESRVAAQSGTKSRSSRLLQRSKSYPQVSRRAIFTPIRPSPEQSGLFSPSHRRLVVDAHLGTCPENGDFVNSETIACKSSTGCGIDRQSKQQQPHPPIARVNPQTNASACLVQPSQPALQAAPNQHLYPQVYAFSHGYFIHDNSVFYQQPGIPFVFLPGAVEGCYVSPDYLASFTTSTQHLPQPLPHTKTKMLEAPLPVAPSENKPLTKQSNETCRSSQSKPNSVRTDTCPNRSSSTAPEKLTNSQEATKNERNEGPHISQLKTSTLRQSGSQTFTKRKHKVPLLPDPLIPKYSEMASLALSSVTSSLPLPCHQSSHPYPQQPYHPQHLSSQPSVFHADSSSVFLQQVHLPTGISSPGVLAVTPQPVAKNYSCKASISSGPDMSQTNNPKSPDNSSPSTVGFVVDQSGLIIYDQQPQSQEVPPPCLQPSPSALKLCTEGGHHCIAGPETQGQQLQSSFKGQQQLSGVVYLPDGSGAYTALDPSTVQARMDPTVYSRDYSPGGSGSYLMSCPFLSDAGESPRDMIPTAANFDNSPATVRMVSSNGPPVPMPMQVPPGHMVQQIMDEHGILTHVILSPQLPGPGGPMTVGPYGGAGSGSQYYTSYGAPHYAPTPPHYPHHPHPHSVPPHMHGGIPHVNSASNASCTNHVSQGDYDDRTLRTRNRVRKKLMNRRVNLTDGYYMNTSRPMGSRRNRMMGMNGDIGVHGDQGYMHGQCIMPENEPLDAEEENSLIIQCLSSMPAPKVTDIEARSSLIQLSGPDWDTCEVDLDPYELKYELLLSDKGRDAKYKTVFCGDATEITLKDLKPSTEYHLKVCALLTDELKGALTDPVSFQTLQCEPDPPPAPRLMSKNKTTIALKWNAACENGSKITGYTLEWDQGQGDRRFSEVYSGLPRQFRLTRLNASTRYVFRLAAMNSLGKSRFSEEVAFLTSGTLPAQPDPPMLSEQFVYALTISWIRRPSDDEFLLQMEDEATGHGFITVYNGPNLSHVQRSLRRNTEYRFRLCAQNEEGQSKWSDAVSYRTLPDRPHPPSKPQIKGKINPHSFRIFWDPPLDTGGTEVTKYIVELDDGQGYDIVYEGSDREHMFDHLTPGHVYHIRAACCNSGGRSEFSDPCVVTTIPVTPSQCQLPKLQGKPKATSLHLRWGYPDYDGGAQVTSFAAQMISPDNTAREVYKGHDRDCIVTGLSPGRPYLFQVRAFNRAGAGPWSEPLEIVSGPGVPDAPKAPHVLCRSAHSALITWDEPFNNGANITEYRLEWQQRADTAEFSQLYVGPNTSFDVKGLVPATMFTFRVQAINSAGPGAFSSTTSCVTPPTSPSPIVSIRVKANATSAVLTWREPSSNGSDITSYNIAVNDKPPISVDPVTEYLLEDLLPETTYKIRIQAVNGIGVGAYSAVVKCMTKTLPPSPPRLELVMLAPTSIKLKWGEGRNSDLLTYTLEMEKEDGSFQPVYVGPAHMHKVTRLTELTSYEFRIFASNEAGSGPYSDTYTFTTTKAPPPPLKAPKTQNITAHGCSLSWQGIKSMGGDSVVYTVQLLCMNGKDPEYRQVYRGSNTQFQLDNLQSNVEYQARVAAIRLSSDSTGDITGVFSPGVIFTPLTPEPLKPGSNPSSGRELRTEERKPWTDQQYAAVILCLFVLLAVVSAFLCQQLISYMSGPEDMSPSSSPSSASASSPSSSPGSNEGFS